MSKITEAINGKQIIRYGFENHQIILSKNIIQGFAMLK